jgi:hypothetical protein
MMTGANESFPISNALPSLPMYSGKTGLEVKKVSNSL